MPRFFHAVCRLGVALWLAVLPWSQGGCAVSAHATHASAPKVFGYVGQDVTYVLTNLHPDPVRHRLYSVNYQQHGLIPRCTPVRLEAMDDMLLTFVRLDTKERYHYYFHRTLTESRDQHLARYFGPSCDRDYPQTLSVTDQQGINSGQVALGMSKAAVIAAMGYPPLHRTASLEADRWVYWRSRFNRVAIEFRDGTVAAIVN